MGTNGSIHFAEKGASDDRPWSQRLAPGRRSLTCWALGLLATGVPPPRDGSENAPQRGEQARMGVQPINPP